MSAREIGLFPLELVLLPSERVPLHIGVGPAAREAPDVDHQPDARTGQPPGQGDPVVWSVADGQ